MAWPLGLGGRNRKQSKDSAEDDISLQRLEAMTNVGYEEVPLPDEGELSEEEAWTISPTSATVRIGSQIASAAAEPSSSGAGANVVASIDTKGLERMMSSRLDMVEDTIRSMSYQLTDAIASRPTEIVEVVSTESADADDVDDSSTPESDSGDRLITAVGQVLPAGAVASSPVVDEGSLMELYEAQALAVNPFLLTPDIISEVSRSVDVGSQTIAALLLDQMTGMAATSFLQKAVQSGMLTEDEYNEVISIVHLALPGDPESALEDRLANKDLLSLSSLIAAWRAKAQPEPSMEG
ncbi:hypothetical protein OAJ94_02865 [Deltaproteobacteria bacterium]|nr:hypothetical protein [Deltaproteobacteria bacterium]